jgi:hypothetical protein
MVDAPLAQADVDSLIKTAISRHTAEKNAKKAREDFAHLVATGRAHPSEHIGWREEQQWLLTRMG